MKSTFFYISHPKLNPKLGESIEADYVRFEPGWVVFYEKQYKTFEGGLKMVEPSRIVKAVHKEACHDLREVLNA